MAKNTKSSSSQGTKASGLRKLGMVVLSHIYTKPLVLPDLVYAVFPAALSRNKRDAAPSLMPPVDCMTAFWENRNTWSRNALRDVRREFAHAVLAYYATDPVATSTLDKLLSAIKAGKRVEITGFGQDIFMWTDARALILAALIRRENDVVNNVAIWSGLELTPLNKPLIESKFERAWGMGLYDEAIIKSDPQNA